MLANLANFAYDPNNMEYLRELQVTDLFLDMLTEKNENFVEFGMGEYHTGKNYKPSSLPLRVCNMPSPNLKICLCHVLRGAVQPEHGPGMPRRYPAERWDRSCHKSSVKPEGRDCPVGHHYADEPHDARVTL